MYLLKFIEIDDNMKVFVLLAIFFLATMIRIVSKEVLAIHFQGN